MIKDLDTIKQLIKELSINEDLINFIIFNSNEIKYSFEEGFKTIFHIYNLRYKRWKSSNLLLPEGLEEVINNLFQMKEMLENKKLSIYCIGNSIESFILFMDEKSEKIFGVMKATNL